MTNIINLIKDKDLVSAKAEISKQLYQRVAEKVACKRLEIAKNFKGKQCSQKKN